MPAIPWTTNTPIDRVSFEKIRFGSMTLIIFYNIFFCPPLGEMMMEQLNLPTYFPTNLTLILRVSSGLILIFSLTKTPFPSTWKTIGTLDVFLSYKNSYNWCPMHIVGELLNISHLTLYFGSTTENVHTNVTSLPSSTFIIILSV